MEDNNAITEQPTAVKDLNYEEMFNKLVVEFNELKETAKQLYGRVKQLENTWVLQRADFLFKIVENNKFNPDIRQKAQLEIEEFLFPTNAESKEDENKED